MNKSNIFHTSYTHQISKKYSRSYLLAIGVAGLGSLQTEVGKQTF
jgi:hypothetical protein